MPHAVSYDEGSGIVHVTFSDSAAKEEHAAALDDAVRICRERGCSRLLVDLSSLVAASLSTVESYAFGEAVAKTPLPLKIAHVLPQQPKARENIQFASDVEANRGKSTGVFESVEKARNWLLG